MLPSAKLFLSNVQYLADKRQIVAEFSNTREKVSKRYSFFPKMFFMLGRIPRGSFLEILSDLSQRLKVDFEGGKATIFGATFSDLKRANNLLADCFGFRSNLVEPERQFLIEKQWGYFDSFSFASGEPELVSSLDFPDIDLDFLSESLKDTLGELLFTNRSLASEIAQKIASSRLLKIPLVGREESKPPADIFLENVFFASSLPLSAGAASNTAPAAYGKVASRADFSRMVPVLSSVPFSNIGFETLNCDCCRPPSRRDKNVLSSTTVGVRFFREGFYFNSVSGLWAQRFHESKPNKGSRAQRRREYCYSFFPVGPFSRGEESEVLLPDAYSLEENGFAEILSDASLSWYCTARESALSREVNALRSWFSRLDLSMAGRSRQVVASKGLFFSQALDSNPEFFFHRAMRDGISSVLSSIPNALSSPGGRFFVEPVGLALDALKGVLLRDFRSAALSSGSTRVGFDSAMALSDADSLLTAFRKFSELYSVDKALVGIQNS